MPAPSNTSFATATDLGTLAGTTPIVVTQDVEDSGTVYTVWYKYTAVPGDTVIGLFPFGDLANYRPKIQIYLTDGGSPYLSILGQNRPLQFPVVAGTTYYFKIAPQGSPVVNPALATTLTLSILRHVDAYAPPGSILVNDDTPGFPAAILSATDGHILRFVLGFPAGERLDILHAANRLIASDETNNTTKLYDTQFTFLCSVAYNTTEGAQANDRSGRFYLAFRGGSTSLNPVVVRSIDTAGVLSGTWTMPSNANAFNLCIAVNNAGTILYTYGVRGADVEAIRRWDLVNNVALTNLADPYTSSDGNLEVRYNLVVLADDTIVALYVLSDPARVQLRHYAANGTILADYDLGTFGVSTNILRMCASLDDATTVWLWREAGDGTDRFSRIRLSDGGVVTEFDAVQFELGVSGMAETATPTARFGHSESCHFGVLPEAIGTPPEPEPAPTCVHACLITDPAPITGGGQGCRAPDAPAVECD